MICSSPLLRASANEGSVWTHALLWLEEQNGKWWIMCRLLKLLCAEATCHFSASYDQSKSQEPFQGWGKDKKETQDPSRAGKCNSTINPKGRIRNILWMVLMTNTMYSHVCGSPGNPEQLSWTACLTPRKMQGSEEMGHCVGEVWWDMTEKKELAWGGAIGGGWGHPQPWGGSKSPKVLKILVY